MPDPEHIKILKRGVRYWNKWMMKEGGYDFPDLTQADLSGLDLRDVTFVNTDLTGACLRKTNLSGAFVGHAFLDRADLAEAHLSETNFRESELKQASFVAAELNGAKFNDAHLQGADFRSARIARVKFINTDLRGANFKGALLGNTIIGRSNLSGAKWLNSCHHEGPSIIDPATLTKSGMLPLKFLRGCGVPENFIEHLPSLDGTDPIQFYSCFISYSSKDHLFAERIYADLQDKGVRCWFAPHHLKIGEKIRVGLDESIRIYDKLLLILSKHSIASDWVEKEVETAMEREREQRRTVLFPIRLDKEVMEVSTGWAADIRRSRNIGDFSKWKNKGSYQKAFDRLLRDLHAGE